MDDFGLLVAQHLAALPTLAGNEVAELQLDSRGRLIIAGRWLSGTDAYAAADPGLAAQAVMQAANTALPGVAEGEYSPMQLDEFGRLKVVAVFDDNGVGTNEYTVTDALADDEDGLDTINATYKALASIAVGAAETLFLYGWQWDADKNATARIIRRVAGAPDVIKVYKVQNNSSAQPGRTEHWGETSRIEIPGAANATVEIQIKTRGSGGGVDGNATASLHARKV